MRKTSFLLLSLLAAALAPGPLHAQRHPMPPNLKLASGIDMRGGPLLRASRVEADLVKVGSDSFTSLADITTPVYAAIVSATNATLAAANSYTDGATNATLTAANSYADGVGTAANSYTDGATNATLTAANSYADGVGTAANSYTDGATNATLTAANSYADTLVGSLRVYTDGTNLFFVTDASVTNTVNITPVK